jgi:negative regulator of flagellin synthesis FlgM
MQIYGPSGVHGAQSIAAPHSRRVDAPQTTGGVQPQDEVQISPAAQAAGYVDQVNSLPDIRQDRVAALRAAIADGSYETPDKLDAALNGLLDEIG